MAAGELERTGRRRVLAAVAAAARPLTTRELAEELGMHRNGVRGHLLRLRDAGLVSAGRAVRGPGRPRDEWAATPAGRAALGDPGATADLARWLAEILAARPDLLPDVEAAGRSIGRGLVAGTETPTLCGALAALGFAPQPEEDASGTTIRLCNCPYREAAASAGQVVCLLHRGITDGLLGQVEPGAELAAFEPHDPFEAGCVVRVTRAPA